ncbi:MAG TPA: hypothetical protein VMW40_06730 [Candidatus Bathyarchaeia archaeon]|nr:hypothetical protein [Candidatus Bathyarchaeia archaeon]
MPSDEEKESWTIDQITKSEFFHQKLHEWGLLEIAYELEGIKGEVFEWNREELGITDRAWNKAIHRGIKPIRVFLHPDVLIKIQNELAITECLLWSHKNQWVG